MNCLIGIQARSNSTRLPKKVLQKIGDKTLLQWVFEACACVRVDGVEIDTKILTPYTDPELQNYCDEHHIPWVAPNVEENDVLGRYLDAGEDYDGTVRITADCWNASPIVIGEAIRNLMKVDYTSNTIIRTFEEGLDVQAARHDAWIWHSYNCTQNEHPWANFDANQMIRDRFVASGFTFLHILNRHNEILTKNSIDDERDLIRAREQVQKLAKA